MSEDSNSSDFKVKKKLKNDDDSNSSDFGVKNKNKNDDDSNSSDFGVKNKNKNDDDSNSSDFGVKKGAANNEEEEEKEEEEGEDEKEELGDELILNPKYEKILIWTKENNVIESEVVIRKENGVKYYNDYKLIKILGEGSICKVKLVEKNNIKYALKVINKQKLSKKKGFGLGGEITNNNLEGIAKEISILRKVCHRNLVKLFEIMNNKKKGKLYLILEYCENGDLMTYDRGKMRFEVNKNIFQKFSKISNNKNLDINSFYYSEKHIRKFIRDIIRGLNYIHRIGIIHGDIKPNNILLDHNYESKIIDFNFSSILDNYWVDDAGSQTNCNDFFRPPEMCNLSFDENEKKKIIKGIPVDIWGIGVTAYVLSYKRFPFEYSDNNYNFVSLYKKIRKDKLKIPNKPKRSSHFKYFLKKCLEKNPDKRITSEKILDLKWLNIGEEESLKEQCSKIIKVTSSKEEINKSFGLLWIDYKYVKSFKDDERPVIRNFANKIIKKLNNVKDEKRIKIKIKLKESKNKKEEE